jgi:hypothetical protein
VVLSVFWGTPLAKPLKCKSVSNRPGARFRQRWTESTGGKLRLSCASIRIVLSDIIKTSFSFLSQCYAFQVSLLLQSRLGNKKPCFHFGKQGLKIFDPMIVTCLPRVYPDYNRPDVSGLRID